MMTVDFGFNRIGVDMMVSGRYASLSGLQAYGVRLQNNTNNIANMNTSGFKKGRVLLSEEKPQGVGAHVEKVETPGPQAMEETGQGRQTALQSNVDLAEEFPEMMLNQHALLANIRSLQAMDEMEKSVLDLKA
ncbi:MAG TPA: flagellar biosynthesis protein FlgC [Desulfobulbus sp.]|nr:flagellar biosynthesis protein FlgC [Desulfobulbus sp.]